MAKAFEYKDEFHLEGFEAQVLAPLYVIDVLRCTFELQSPERMLHLRKNIKAALPVAREKNGYSRRFEATGGYRDIKIDALFPCGPAGAHVITEIQMALDANVQLKRRSHELYVFWIWWLYPLIISVEYIR